MDFKNDNVGIELLLAHMNIGDIIQAVEHLYSEREEEESGVLFDECLSQDEMDENEETSGDLASHMKLTPNRRAVQYGTVSDLLAFVNMVSNTPASTFKELQEEVGVLLNKVSCLDLSLKLFIKICHFKFI